MQGHDTQRLGEASKRRLDVLRQFFRLPFPCCFITKGLTLSDEFVHEAAAAGMPLFRSPLKTNEFYRRIKPALEEEFAPRTTLRQSRPHGALDQTPCDITDVNAVAPTSSRSGALLGPAQHLGDCVNLLG